MNQTEILTLMRELIEQQRKVVLSSAHRIVPGLTEDDLLQPNDFPELEMHPHFRHEEGILDGLQIAQAAFLRKLQES